MAPAGHQAWPEQLFASWNVLLTGRLVTPLLGVWAGKFHLLAHPRCVTNIALGRPNYNRGSGTEKVVSEMHHDTHPEPESCPGRAPVPASARRRVRPPRRGQDHAPDHALPRGGGRPA